MNDKHTDGRKLRSQTSDNMDRWKSRGGKSQRGEEKKRQDQRRESEKKEDAGARKGRKVANHCVFPMICGSRGSKSRLAKAAGAEPSSQMRDEKLHAVVARSTVRSQNVRSSSRSEHFWKLRCRKKCAPLWREAHFEVKLHKAHHDRSTFGSWNVEKVHAVVVRSTFASEKAENTASSDHFWKLRCRKSARRCGAKHISNTKHTILGPLLEVEMSKKCTPLWREAHLQVKKLKTPHLRTTFGSWDVEKVHAVVAQSTFPSQKCKKLTGTEHFWTRECAPCQKWAKRDGFVAFPKAMAGVGHLKRIRKDAFRVAGAIQETCSSEMLGGQGRDSLRRLHILEHQICRFAKMILRDRCSTSYDLASLVRGKRST